MLLKQENQIFKKVLPHTGFLPPNKHFPYLNKIHTFLKFSFQYNNKRPNFWFCTFWLQSQGLYSKPWDLTPNQGDLLKNPRTLFIPWNFSPNLGNLLITQGIYSEPKEIYSNPRGFTPNPGNLLHAHDIYSNPKEFTKGIYSKPKSSFQNPENLLQILKL